MKKRLIKNKSSQAGVEYMIIIGFVTLAILSVLVLSNYYSELTKDRIRLNQVESFASQVVNNAESVFFAGEPSEVTVNLYLPDGVKSIEILSDAIVVTTRTSTGNDVRAYNSNVPLKEGSVTSSEGIKVLSIKARPDYVEIAQ